MQRRPEGNPLLTGRDNTSIPACTPPGPIPYLRDRALVLRARPEADEQEDYGLPQHLAMDRAFIWVADMVPNNEIIIITLVYIQGSAEMRYIVTDMSFQRLHYGTDISTLRSLN
jgi:hypothetical protein